MNFKKILVISLILLSVFLIYLSTIDTKVYYLVLGNNLNFDVSTNEKIEYSNSVRRYLEKNDLLEIYVDQYVSDDERITDLINSIETNKQVEVDNKKYTLKNVLIKADLLTISVGYSELYTKLLVNNSSSDIYKYIDELIEDYDNLFELIRKYCKEDIILIGYYTTDSTKEKYIDYLNNKLVRISKKYNLHFVNTSYYNNNLSNEVIKIIEANILD